MGPGIFLKGRDMVASWKAVLYPELTVVPAKGGVGQYSIPFKLNGIFGTKRLITSMDGLMIYCFEAGIAIELSCK
jgi:hypothetical protein